MVHLLLFLLFIGLAGAFKAVADTLRDHYSTSIFSKKDPRFWNPVVSSQHMGFIKFTKYRPDAWHLSNSFMITSFLFSCYYSPPFAWWAIVLFGGMWFILAFNLFYNQILKRK